LLCHCEECGQSNSYQKNTYSVIASCLRHGNIENVYPPSLRADEVSAAIHYIVIGITTCIALSVIASRLRQSNPENNKNNPNI
jgi:hypothetical protein